jgi:hypothetical protein
VNVRFGFEPATRYGLRDPFAGQRADGFVIAEEDMMILPLDDRVRQLENHRSAGIRRSDESRLKLRITVPRMDAQSADVAQW